MSLWPDILDALDGVTRQRVAWLTFGGTWGVPGTGYCSWVVQAADEGLVYELPVPGPYAFGPVPAVAQNEGLDAPSYRQSVAIAKTNGVAIVEALPPWQPWAIAGYSMGGECAADVADELQPGGQLEDRAATFVGGFTIGNPRRMDGAGLGPGLVPVPGHGISPNPMTVLPRNWVDYVNIDAGMPDRYAAVPDGLVGEIMGDGYDFGVDLQLNNPADLIGSEAQHALKILKDVGVGPSTLAGGLPGLLALAPALFIGAAGALIPQLGSLSMAVSGNPKIAAAAQAAVLGLEFALSGVRPHVTYDVDYITPGVTFLQHAVGHVNATSRAALVA